MSRALQDLRPFCHWISRLSYYYHVNEHEKLHQIWNFRGIRRQIFWAAKGRISGIFRFLQLWQFKKYTFENLHIIAVAKKLINSFSPFRYLTPLPLAPIKNTKYGIWRNIGMCSLIQFGIPHRYFFGYHEYLWRHTLRHKWVKIHIFWKLDIL